MNGKLETSMRLKTSDNVEGNIEDAEDVNMRDLDMKNMDMEDVEDVEDVENVEDIEDTKDMEDVEDVENIEDTRDTGKNIEQNMGKNIGRGVRGKIGNDMEEEEEIAEEEIQMMDDSDNSVDYGSRGSRNSHAYQLSYKFEAPRPVTPYSIKIDRESVLRRFGRPGALAELQDIGTVKIVGFWSWITKNLDIMRCIFVEFDMYEYHRSIGWLRNCYHSLFQQVSFQDPTFWALTVAGREDGNYWQISYPYYQKYAFPGEGVAFSHVDVNISEWLKTGRGQNRI
ncbi:hypothetical protein TWF173_009155 [Orbilia oligospora]|nr:hypothetical protein TWF173_009155 [Orbilia oligospora]